MVYGHLTIWRAATGGSETLNSGVTSTAPLCDTLHDCHWFSFTQKSSWEDAEKCTQKYFVKIQKSALKSSFQKSSRVDAVWWLSMHRHLSSKLTYENLSCTSGTRSQKGWAPWKTQNILFQPTAHFVGASIPREAHEPGSTPGRISEKSACYSYAILKYCRSDFWEIVTDGSWGWAGSARWVGHFRTLRLEEKHTSNQWIY